MRVTLLVLTLAISVVSGQYCDSYEPDVCQGHTGGVFIRSPKYCQRWIQCHQDQIFTCGTCDNGFYFNPATSGCNYHTEVNCRLITATCTPGLNHRVPSRNSCTIYYQCLADGDPIEQHCVEGTHFSEENERCEMIETVQCRREPPVITCPTTDLPFINIPHPWNCGQYYLCIGDTYIQLECPANQIFDVESGLCQTLDRATCVEGADMPVDGTV